MPCRFIAEAFSFTIFHAAAGMMMRGADADAAHMPHDAIMMPFTDDAFASFDAAAICRHLR